MGTVLLQVLILMTRTSECPFSTDHQIRINYEGLMELAAEDDDGETTKEVNP